jgi:hypothetical protein
MKKSVKSTAVESLKSANKEVKSISGVCKIIAQFWNEGYKDAFKEVGITDKKQLTPAILKQIQSEFVDEKGVICRYVKVNALDDEQQAIPAKVLKNGKVQYLKEWKLRPIKTWSANILFELLWQVNHVEDYI